MNDDVEQFRRFNRVVTRRVGALDAHFLGRGHSLGVCRVLFEIGEHGIDLRRLRQRLGLDSGYASRLLRGLESEGLARTEPAPGDARARQITLTDAGRDELAAINRLSDAAAGALLDSLDERRRAQLTTAMATVERLMRAAAVTVEVESPTTADARECLARYYQELAERFEEGFDVDVAIPVVVSELVPPGGYFVMARLDEEPVGCVALRCYDDFAEVKRMWVARDARGLGVGRRLLVELERLARERSLPALRLETNRVLTEAQALYRSSGFVEIEPYNAEPYAHHWFEKRLR